MPNEESVHAAAFVGTLNTIVSEMIELGASAPMGQVTPSAPSAPRPNAFANVQNVVVVEPTVTFPDTETIVAPANVESLQFVAVPAPEQLTGSLTRACERLLLSAPRAKPTV